MAATLLLSHAYFQCKSIDRSGFLFVYPSGSEIEISPQNLKIEMESLFNGGQTSSAHSSASRFRQAAWRPEKRAWPRPLTRQISICQSLTTDLTADFAICWRLVVTPQASPHFYHENVHETDIDRWRRSPPFIVCLGPDIAPPSVTGSLTNWFDCGCHLHFDLANRTKAGRDVFAVE
jgi:hypothetical protein